MLSAVMMDQIIKFILENKEWIFSGIGVFILVIFISFFAKLFRRDDKTSINSSPTYDGLPRLVILPNGESIHPEEVDGVEITGRGPYNVCLVYESPGYVSKKSIYFTYSHRKAKKFAIQATRAINAATLRKQ